MSNNAASHKPRRKKKSTSGISRTETNADLVSIDEQTHAAKPEFPLVAFLWPTRGTTSQWLLVPLILIIVGLFRWTVGLWGYSGLGKPPMHGDFEAQRHWMEITNHLPMSLWYFHDLEYWGLDYPPLTAYHSWLLGKIGSFIEPSWFALVSSRGLETQLLKVYMRATVIVSEYLVYVPAAIIFLRRYGRAQGVGATSQSVALVAFLMQPATILVDHGHFQYNTVMLGFAIAALSSIYAGRLMWSCIFFVAALGYKQMALYYSPIIFAYLLGSCVTPRMRIGRLLGITTITIVSLVALYIPLIIGSLSNANRGVLLTNIAAPPLLDILPFKIHPKSAYYMPLLQVTQSLHRIFPFSRGLFEDKVANFWCALNTVLKIRQHIEPVVPLPRLSLYLTFMGILGPMLLIGAVPRPNLLPYALASSAWAFYLFSFQVHEKSVLLPLLPMTLLLGSRDGLTKETRAWVGWANMVGTWTLYPLLKRDGLRTPYFVITLLWAYLLGLPPTSGAIYYDHANQNEPGKERQPEDLYTGTKILHGEYYMAMMIWHGLEAFIPPPEGKPDLWVVVNVCLGAFAFGICYLWCTWKLVLGTNILDGYFGHRRKIEEKGADSRGRKSEKKTQ
ncbi:hypothetical protein EPUS_00866 [Endocarpon pusillum Z07020]|uniref:Alpha-1,3-glucosyltransferase n=1 Tax=Endocarpon pusillum (strain Z07020 / HMAS-L-300199) TaxID=1263415 RepID=U1GMX1_ENDPU|nr:uncharacterized protein EPUS_00866 [Endocarpon pusillum Z07020]ERF73613.1 hypothetical protein EPUS_00866 [Endocarpon pusillum Z07020]